MKRYLKRWVKDALLGILVGCLIVSVVSLETDHLVSGTIATIIEIAIIIVLFKHVNWEKELENGI